MAPLALLSRHRHLALRREKAVVAKALCEMDGAVMRTFRDLRGHWALHDNYRCPGPIQVRAPSGGKVFVRRTLNTQLHDQCRCPGPIQLSAPSSSKVLVKRTLNTQVHDRCRCPGPIQVGAHSVHDM